MGKTRQVPDKFSIVRSIQERGRSHRFFHFVHFALVFIFLSDFGVWGTYGMGGLDSSGVFLLLDSTIS